MQQFKLNQDVLAGPMFVGFGLAGLWLSRDYPAGTAADMGPGYVPFVLCMTLVVLGAAIAIKGFFSGEPLSRDWGIGRLVVVLTGMLAFAALVETAGLAISVLVTTVIVAAAGRDFRYREVALLAVALSAAAVCIFVYGLKLPLSVLWP